jgi:hypothetical protein
MYIKFKKDAESVVAPDGVYKKGSIHDVHFADAQNFLENEYAEPVTQTDLEAREKADIKAEEKRKAEAAKAAEEAEKEAAKQAEATKKAQEEEAKKQAEAAKAAGGNA